MYEMKSHFIVVNKCINNDLSATYSINHIIFHYVVIQKIIKLPPPPRTQKKKKKLADNIDLNKDRTFYDDTFSIFVRFVLVIH